MKRYNILLDDQSMTALIAQYATGQNGIQVYCDEGPYATLTIPVAGVDLAYNEVIVPIYKVDQNIIDQLVNQDFWENTGRAVELSFGHAPIYRLKVVEPNDASRPNSSKQA